MVVRYLMIHKYDAVVSFVVVFVVSITLACGLGPWRASAYFASPFFFISITAVFSIMLNTQV